jgi:hypothetical protein
MTDDMARLPMHHPDESPATRNGAAGRKPCRRHEWDIADGGGDLPPVYQCVHCSALRDPAASRRGRTNRSRGNRAELDVARSIPGGRKMGPLGLPWDVEVGTYARLQCKKLATRPSSNAIRKLIEAIPATGDRLRGFVWVEAAGQGKRGQRLVWFLAREFAAWHGTSGWTYGLDVGRGSSTLVRLPLDGWVAEFVS